MYVYTYPTATVRLKKGLFQMLRMCTFSDVGLEININLL